MDIVNISNDFDSIGFKKFKHVWTSFPLGIYYEDTTSIGIIEMSWGDWGLAPFLIIYDPAGNKIDSTSFYNKSGEDVGYFAMEYITFKNERTISVTDTTQRWELNEDKSDIVEGTKIVSTGQVIYKVIENGKIKKLTDR